MPLPKGFIIEEEPTLPPGFVEETAQTPPIEIKTEEVGNLPKGFVLESPVLRGALSPFTEIAQKGLKARTPSSIITGGVIQPLESLGQGLQAAGRIIPPLKGVGETLTRDAETLRGKYDVAPESLLEEFGQSAAGSIPLMAGAAIGAVGLGALGVGGGAAAAIASIGAAGTEAIQNAGEARKRVLEKGGNPKEADIAAGKVFITTLPVSAILNKITLFGEAGTALKRIAQQFTGEVTEEGWQKYMGNLAAKDPWYEGLVKAAAFGGIMGIGGGQIADAVTRRVAEHEKGKTVTSNGTEAAPMPPQPTITPQGEVLKQPSTNVSAPSLPLTSTTEEKPSVTIENGKVSIDLTPQIQAEVKKAMEQAGVVKPATPAPSEQPQPIQETPKFEETTPTDLEEYYGLKGIMPQRVPPVEEKSEVSQPEQPPVNEVEQGKETPFKAKKEPWEMTNVEYTNNMLAKSKNLSYRDMAGKITNFQKSYAPQHTIEIKKALSEGKPVPPEVLADYPELRKKDDFLVNGEPGFRGKRIPRADESNYAFTVTSKELIETRTREKIQDKLQKIFGGYEQLEKIDDGEAPVTPMYELANQYMANMERAAVDRDYHDLDPLLEALRNDIIAVKQGTYVTEEERAEKERQERLREEEAYLNRNTQAAPEPPPEPKRQGELFRAKMTGDIPAQTAKSNLPLGKRKFRLPQDRTKRRPSLNPQQQEKVRRLNKEIFGDDRVNFVERILENPEAVAKYENTWMTFMESRSDEEIQDDFWHEGAHRYFDQFATDEERFIVYKELKRKTQFRSKDSIGKEEHIAELFSRYKRRQRFKAGHQTFSSKVWEAIGKVLDRIQRYLTNRKKLRDIFDDISRGEAKNRTSRFETKGKAPISEGLSSETSPKTVSSTPEFKRWFGDSKVVDENGKPLVVYHGTQKDIYQFDNTKNTRRNTQIAGETATNKSFWFAENRAVTEFFANGGVRSPQGALYPGAKIMSVYLSIQDPLIVDMYDFKNIPIISETKRKAMRSAKEGRVEGDGGAFELNKDIYNIGEIKEQMTRRAQKEGKDGIIFKNGYDFRAFDGDIYAVFSPTQIKSATGNVGTFDPNNPDIRYRIPKGTPDPYKDRNETLSKIRKIIEQRGLSAEAIGKGIMAISDQPNFTKLTDDQLKLLYSYLRYAQPKVARGVVNVGAEKEPWRMRIDEWEKYAEKGKLHKATGKTLPGEDGARTQFEMGVINEYTHQDIAHFYLRLRTYGDGTRTKEMTKIAHEEYLEAAILAGKSVPAEVLADYPQLQKKAPMLKLMTKSETKVAEMEQAVKGMTTPLKDKVNVIDYIRTPEKVMEKIGLADEMKLLREGWDKYIKELPKNIDKITAWSKRVSKESNEKIFRNLDGENIILNDEENKVAIEIREWLQEWAQRLKLPPARRISTYITHIFDDEQIQKEFDEELAKIIDPQLAKSVYNPFLLKRIGAPGYIRDTWLALDAYVKRGTRKVHVDPALEEIGKKSKNLELSQWKYVKKYVDRVNMRPTEFDSLIDNGIKQVVGYRFGQRPVARISRILRAFTYRAKLGLNVSSALRNLSQGANNYAKLGEKYTIIGYTKLLSKANTQELIEEGVFNQGFVQDRTLSATKKALEKFDKVLFFLFETAEHINRGAAYFGGKAKALAQGKTEQEAKEYGKKIVRETQFLFSQIDTPVFLQNDLLKTMTQFQTYNTKQIEFLTDMLKKKEYVGLIRYGAAGLLFVMTLGQIFGMEPEDLLPALQLGWVPPSLKFPAEVVKAAINTRDKYGNERDTARKIGDVTKEALGILPGSSQIFKSAGMAGAMAESGRVRSRSGKRVNFRIDTSSPFNVAKGYLFGKYQTKEGQEYLKNRHKKKYPTSPFRPK